MKIKKKSLAFLLMTLPLLALPNMAQDQEKNHWIQNPANGHYYQLLPNANWTTSERWAERLGGHLATIENDQEQQWVFDTFAKGGTQRLLWIGLSDRNNGGQFYWVDDSPVEYTNWAKGEPNGVDNIENFVAMYYADFNAPGTWNDWENREKDPVSIPFQGVVEVER